MDHKIPKVVVACLDPHEKVAGKGIEILRNKGVEVTTGIMEKEAIALNKRFFCYHQKQRPFIKLKWAQSQDGFMDVARKDGEKGSFQISNPASQQLAHRWRVEESAILIGSNTAKVDNPRLTPRLVEGPAPLRVIISSSAKLPADLHLLQDDFPTLVYNNEKDQEGEKAFKQIDFSAPVLPQILNDLHKRGVNSVLVEGGQQTLNAFIEADLWDEAHVFESPAILGGGLSAPTIQATCKTTTLDDNLYRIYTHA